PVGATAARADPTPSPSPTVVLPLTLQLQGVSPLAPQPGQQLVVRARLTNGSGESVTGLQPRLLVSPSRVSSRGQFDDYAATPDGDPPPDAVTATTARTSIGRTSLPPGAGTNVRFVVPVDDLDLPQSWQVYEVGVVVSGSTTLGVRTVAQ